MNLKELKGIDLLKKFKEAFLQFKTILRDLKFREQLDLLGLAEKDARETEEEILRRLNSLDDLLAGDGSGEFGSLNIFQLLDRYDEQMAIVFENQEPARREAVEKLHTAQGEAAKLRMEIIRRRTK